MSALRRPEAGFDPVETQDPWALFERLLEQASGDEETVPVLVLADLVPDTGGEIVLRPGGLDRRFRIAVSVLPVESGRATPHVTAAGEDVTGFRFVRFPRGPTLYHPADVELEFVVLDA